MRLERLSPKVLSQQVLRLQQQYHVSPGECPLGKALGGTPSYMAF